MKTINNDIRHPDILVEIGRMISAGMTYASISRAIKNDFEISASPQYVKKVYETYAARRKEVLMGDEALKEEIKEEILDWKEQLRQINQITWKLIKDADTGTKLKALKEVRGQLELQSKILSRLESSMSGQIANRIQITQDVLATLEKLEEEGMIKILRNPKNVLDATPVKQLEKKEEEENDEST